ncbi:MAG: glycosyltransferase family 2 protein [Clostridia bacterium]|nr:glycosyltransferase family 2 protein [Clostridia bacterium]
MSLAVIIPNYNNEKFIRKCLDSVLSQTYQPDEIIVVDDCSKDNSVEIIKEYEAKYPNVKGVYLQQNGGVSHARNTGILTATSEYVTTLDGDDFYFNNQKLENEMKLLQEKGGNVLTYSKIVYCDEDDNIIRYLDYKNSEYFEGNLFDLLLKEKITKTLMRDCCFPRQAVIDAGLYDEQSSLYEDYDLLIRLAKIIPFYCTFEYGTAYRQKNFGLSQRPIEECIKAKETIIKKYFSELSVMHLLRIKLYRSIRRFMVKLKKILK